MGFSRLCKLIFSIGLAMLLAAVPMACGNQPQRPADDASEREFKVRESITGALQNDRTLDEDARNT
ncbi:MAG: hypothetical protein MUO75_06430, partial [Actinobacteria bacterium]|nr:hypothetical protein [Actinomycetota bacterium]